MKIIRNAAGVPGLMLGLECFSEDVERRLFFNSELFPFEEQSPGSRTAHAVHTYKHGGSDLFKLNNLVSDSGLFPENVMPDCCLGLSYALNAAFQSHFDSKYRWAETVVGVSLGRAGTIYFTPAKGNTAIPSKRKSDATDQGLVFRVKPTAKTFAIELDLPRRSIYVMSGAARTDWRHGIRKQMPQRLAQLPPPPTWNARGVRRSLTLRSTKAYSDTVLQDRIRQQPTNPSYRERWDKQSPQTTKLWPQYEGGVLNKQELVQEYQRGQRVYGILRAHPFKDQRFSVAELNSSAASGQGGGFGSGTDGAGVPNVPAIAAALTANGLGGVVAFAGAGHLLGGGSDDAGYDNEQAMIDEAIRQSLMESAASSQASANSNNNNSMTAASSKTNDPATGTASSPIAIDDDDDEDDGDDDDEEEDDHGNEQNVKPKVTDTKKRSAADPPSDKPASTQESLQEKRKKLAAAALARFEKTEM